MVVGSCRGGRGCECAHKRISGCADLALVQHHGTLWGYEDRHKVILTYGLIMKQRLIFKDDGVIALMVEYYFKTIVKVRSQQKYLIYNTNQPPILLYKAKRLH